MTIEKTQRAAARALGVSHVALGKAVKAGRVKTLPDGSYDIDACRKAFKANSSPIKSRAGRSQNAGLVTAAVTNAEDSPGDDLPSGECLAEAERQLKWEQVRALKQKTDRENGLLAEVPRLNAWFAGVIMKARDDLSRVGSELADRLSQAHDPVICKTVVDDRIFQCLEGLRCYEPD